VSRGSLDGRRLDEEVCFFGNGGYSLGGQVFMAEPTSSPQTPSAHIWRFFRAGNVDQVRLDIGADLVALPTFDQKLWVSLSCPTRGLEFDSKTLDLIDTDHDGRIRCPEIIEAVRWTLQHIKDPNDLVAGHEVLPLSAINDREESGARVLASAKHILGNLGKPENTSISLADTQDEARIFAQTKFNGDGIVPPESAPTPETRQVILDIIETLGGEADRSGAIGVGKAKVDRFFAELEAYAQWRQKAGEPSPDGRTILTLGGASSRAWAALDAVRAKIADFFLRCSLAAFDRRASGVLNRSEADFVAFAGLSLAENSPEVAALPLARVEAGRALPLTGEVNPAWRMAIERFRMEVVEPIYDAEKRVLSQAEWEVITERFAPYQQWLSAKQGSAVEKLGDARVTELLKGPYRTDLTDFVARDLAVAPEIGAIAEVEKLIRYHRDIVTLLRNCVSLEDFYRRDRLAIFQAGTLFLDGRSCDLCIKVDDIGKHAAMAQLGRIYLVYCELRRAGVADKRAVAAAFTAGTSDRLAVGRNGVFYDRDGKDWDATVVKVIEHPISLKEAMWAPFRRLGKLVSEQFEKIASSREQAVQTSLTQGLTSVQQQAAAAQPPKAAAGAGGPTALVGILAGGGVAIAALSSAAAVIASTLSKMDRVSLLLSALGLFAAISGPSVLVAYFKLRARDLGPILDASGWAINGRLRLTISLGHVLTQQASVPIASRQFLEELYPKEPRKTRRWLWLLALLAAIVLALKLAGYLGG